MTNRCCTPAATRFWRAANGGDGPNPAGLVGGLLVTLDNGERVERKTEPASWKSSADGENWTDASLIGPLGCGPWGPLEGESASKASLAWIHRRCRDRDIYFLANSLAKSVDVTVSLRSTGQGVQLFDPLDGSVRNLPERIVTPDGRTQVPLHFGPTQACFVVLREGPDSAGAGRNFPDLQPVRTVEGPWQVTFDARWVKPLPASSAPDAKDMSYNNGPMISERHFDEFIAPYYRQLVPRLLEKNVIPLVDMDGM